MVHGDRGRITFWYKLDRVSLERAGHGPETTDHARTDLLENLVAHLRDGTELLVPPQRTGAFMRVVEAVRTAPDPVRLPADAWRTEPVSGGASAKRRVVPGIDRPGRRRRGAPRPLLGTARPLGRTAPRRSRTYEPLP